MTFDLTEKRYIKETGLEMRIARIVEPVANGLGYALVRVKITQENGCTLQIMAEDANGRFTITDCERLSKDLSPVLDVEDPIDREYHLEVSSPGIDRPLVRARDYKAFIGHEAKIELGDPIEGRKRFRGEIAAATDDTVTIHLPDVPIGADPDHVLPLAAIAEAKLLMTDALIKMQPAIEDDPSLAGETGVELIEDNLEHESTPLDDPEADPAEEAASHHQHSEETN